MISSLTRPLVIWAEKTSPVIEVIAHRLSTVKVWDGVFLWLVTPWKDSTPKKWHLNRQWLNKNNREVKRLGKRRVQRVGKCKEHGSEREKSREMNTMRP